VLCERVASAAQLGDHQSPQRDSEERIELAFSGPRHLASALPTRLGPIAAFPFTIGRGKQAEGMVQATPAMLRLSEETFDIISRAQASLERSADGALLVRELGSVNGTWWTAARAATDGASEPSEPSKGDEQTSIRLRRSDGVTENAFVEGDSVSFENKLVQYTLRAAQSTFFK
jgi:hypothetical protein